MKTWTALTTRCRLARLTVVGALVVMSLVAACGSSATAGPQRSVTVSDLQRKQYFYQADFLGRAVTLTAMVSDVLGPRVFELSGGDLRDTKLLKLLVVTDQPVDISEGQAVRVTGTAGQLHVSFPSDHVPYEQENLYTRYNTKPYVYHATVERLAATQHGATGSISSR